MSTETKYCWLTLHNLLNIIYIKLLVIFKRVIYIHQEKYFKKTAQLFQEEGHETAVIETEDEQLLYSYSK